MINVMTAILALVILIGSIAVIIKSENEQTRLRLSFLIAGLLILISAGVFYLIGTKELSGFIAVPFSILSTLILLLGIAMFYISKEDRSMKNGLARTKALIEQEKMDAKTLEDPTDQEIKNGILKLEEWINLKHF